MPNQLQKIQNPKLKYKNASSEKRHRPELLGQHFLINKFYLDKIVKSLNLQENDWIIEIGSGHGELTQLIAEKFQLTNSKPRNSTNKLKVIAIEKDPLLVSYIMDHMPSANLEIIHGDALKILPQIISRSMIHDPGYKITGNIPYYITGYLFRILADLEPKPKIIVFTIQKEVAERICSQPPKMNRLAASVQFWAKPEIIDYIPKTAFSPKPKVDSAIIKLIPKSCIMDHVSYHKLKTTYYKLIRILFKQPRKTILNNLRAAKNTNLSEWREKLLKIGINPNDRPQNLTINQIITLSTP